VEITFIQTHSVQLFLFLVLTLNMLNLFVIFELFKKKCIEICTTIHKFVVGKILKDVSYAQGYIFY